MFEHREGQRVPDVSFRTRQRGEWVNVDTASLFGGRTVVVFALPGAFTPTCSSAHVPRYNELAPLFRDNGVDEIVCISVNDGFVMEAWREDQQADAITFIPDGNAAFTSAMGVLVDKAELGFGQRSWRYSMLVRDGIIVKQFIEPDEPGDPFKVSDADTMLAYINSKARKPDDVALFTKPGCPYCARAKQALTARGIAYTEIVLGRDAELRALRAVTGAQSVPQVYVNGRHVGDSEALERWLTTAAAA